MFPQRGQFDHPCRLVSSNILDLLVSEEDHLLNIVQYPYVGMDAKGCPNILFSQVNPPDSRRTLIVNFLLI